jgi:Ca2+-binding RTX toxin-like protein
MTLTFTQDNWQLAQTVTLVGLDDAIHDGNMAFSMQTVVSSTDLRYDGMRSGTGFTLPNINVTNTDDDAPDVIYGDANGIVTADLLHGGNGASDVHGRDGRDEIYGGNGNDRLYGGYGDDVLFGEADNDELEGEQGNDNLNGGAGNDKLLGGSGVDTLMGGDGDDILDGLTDADSMDGGNGQDTYYVDNPGDIIKDSGSDAAKDTVYITVVLATGYTLDVGIDDATLNTDAVNGALIGNTGNNTLMGNGSNNNLNGGTGADSLSGGDGADNLLGGLGNDLLYGGNGDDAVEGGDGNDLIVGGDGAGNDRYNGGTGADTVKYSSATAAINVNLTTGKASGVDISNDTLSLIENVIGGKGNDTLVGNALANTLTGDTGNDNLDGGAGNDKMIGGAGNDTYHVRQNADVVTEVLNAGTDTVHSYLTAYVLPAQIENGRIMLTGAANLTGNSLANTLYASKGNNVLTGGEGVDAVSYQFGLAGTAGVSVNLALASAQTTGGSGSDTLIGIENLIGSDKADTLFGNVDNNVLTGAGGKDVLTGNGGNDIFDFNALSEMGSSLTTADVISDFNSGDKIDLSTLDANTATATNDAFKAVFVSSFTAAGQLKFSDGVLYGNTDADATAEFMLVLTGVNTLSASGLVL